MLKKMLVSLIASLLIGMIAYAEVPQLINYQAVLTDATGIPINDTRAIEFRIYEDETGGTPSWTETQTVAIDRGLLNVLLGSITPLPYSLFDGNDKFLALKVGTDAEMIPRKKLVSMAYAYHAHNTDNFSGMNVSGFARSVDGVSPDDGNIDLIAGSNVTITPDNSNHRITISASGGTGGDDLGNHVATKNIQLNSHWLSGDGNNEGVFVDGNGDVGIGTSPGYKLHVAGTSYANTDLRAGRNVITGSPSSSYQDGDIVATRALVADYKVLSSGNIESLQGSIIANYSIRSDNGYIRTGSPSAAHGNGDVASTKNVIADENVIAQGSVVAGTPTVGYSSGDIVAGDDLKAGKNVDALNDVLATRNIVSYSGHIRTGSPSLPGYGDGDIVAEDDVRADNYVYAGNSVIAVIGHIRTGTPSTLYDAGDIAAVDDLIADDQLICGGTKNAYLKTQSYGTRLFYCEEATEVYFFDRGHGQLANGEAVIQLDPMFLEAVTIDQEHQMIVQITLTADCNGVFVAEKTTTSFTVKELMKGSSNATFDWEVACKRRQYEADRMEVLSQE
ncbi:hypothetical protein JXJ21_01000 [candidate division KSB1 bacterium]|nr:hypothetical protein [candidate division KSB1 bacterium]